MRGDFTLSTYRNLLETLLEQGYRFIPFCEAVQTMPEKTVILRHDVDRQPVNSLKTAVIEHRLGIRSTYNFRIAREGYNEKIIRKIAGLGHEIGYHYEDLALAIGDPEKAIESFQTHLARLRSVAAVKTICMHGSPMSKWDSRKLWEKYDYRDFGLAGEPYFDTDFSKVLYLTDTGRRWDGEKVSVRDKPPGMEPSLSDSYSFHTTFDIITAVKTGNMPGTIMINTYPQRWTNSLVLWLKELVLQRTKNVVKGVVVWWRG